MAGPGSKWAVVPGGQDVLYCKLTKLIHNTIRKEIKVIGMYEYKKKKTLKDKFLIHSKQCHPALCDFGKIFISKYYLRELWFKFPSISFSVEKKF